MSAYLFFSSRRRHTRYWRDWSSDVCSSDLSCSRISTNCKEILICRIKRHRKNAAQHNRSNKSSYRLLHLHSRKTNKQKAQEREKKYQKCITVFHFLIISCFRYCSPDHYGNYGKH